MNVLYYHGIKEVTITEMDLININAASSHPALQVQP